MYSKLLSLMYFIYKLSCNYTNIFLFFSLSTSLFYIYPTYYTWEIKHLNTDFNSKLEYLFSKKHILSILYLNVSTLLNENTKSIKYSYFHV